MPWTRIRIDHHDQPSLLSRHVGDLNHGDDVPCEFIQYKEQDLRRLFGLVLQLYHFWNPVCLLRIVIRDALRFEIGYGNVLPPGGRVARPAQEDIVG